jgi:hypothetical protein
LVDAWWLVHYCFVDTDWLVVRFVGLIIGQKDLAFGLLISLCQHWEPAPVGRIWRIPSTVHQNKRCHGEWYCVYIYTHTGWWFGTAVTAQRLSRSAADLSRALGGTVSPCFLPCLEIFPWTLVAYQMDNNWLLCVPWRSLMLNNLLIWW